MQNPSGSIQNAVRASSNHRGKFGAHRSSKTAMCNWKLRYRRRPLVTRARDRAHGRGPTVVDGQTQRGGQGSQAMPMKRSDSIQASPA